MIPVFAAFPIGGVQNVRLLQIKKRLVFERNRPICQLCQASLSSEKSEQASQLPGGQPWSLTGRVIREEKIDINTRGKIGLVALKVSGGDYQSKENQRAMQKIEELLQLVPELEQKIGRMDAKILKALIFDLVGVVERMVYLKRRLPLLDVNALVVGSPWLLVEKNFIVIPGNLDKLKRRIDSEEDVTRMVQQVPVILTQDIDMLSEKVSRQFAEHFPQYEDRFDLLIAYPELCNQLLDNRGLSLW
eukprot:TRINITY_DN4240_c0_g1_i5.p1 TRINITY_DN4240_c0_g1~~TRINITY_DN4240_c0_g1_i5.p1  ORF type:complete len:246 (+),score=19.78 TRINITY_DN4240_c0_g1_i5:888-1625(+)